MRVPRAIALAAVLAAVTSWALRDNARYLPTAGARPNPLAASGHGHGDGYQPPAAITGEALANHVGLGVFALHVLMISVVAVSCLLRRRHGTTVDGVAHRIAYSTVVAIVAALVALCMAGILLGGAISLAAGLSAAVTVLRCAFVLALAFSAVFGIP